MNAGTIRRRKLLKGTKVVSTADLPYVSWMSVHGRDLAAAVEYERKCRICREEVRRERINELIGGTVVDLKANTLANGLMFATIHDRKGGLVFDAREYGGVSVMSDANGHTAYMAVTRMARIASHACLGNGFELRYLDADAGQQSTYNVVSKEYVPGKGRMISLEYCMEYSGRGVIQLLDLHCLITSPERTERLIIGADGGFRENRILRVGEIGKGKPAIPGAESKPKRVIAEVIRAVVSGADFSLQDIAEACKDARKEWHPLLAIREWIGRLAA